MVFACDRTQTGTKLATVSEAEVRAAFTARLGMPLTGQMLPGTLPFYPSLAVIEGGEATSTGGYVHKQMQQNMEHPSVTNRQHPPSAVYHGSTTANPITDTQVAHARLQKAGHRPLGSMFSLLSCQPIIVSTRVRAIIVSHAFLPFFLPSFLPSLFSSLPSSFLPSFSLSFFPRRIGRDRFAHARNWNSEIGTRGQRYIGSERFLASESRRAFA